MSTLANAAARRSHLEWELAEMRPGTHACLLYDTPDQMAEAVAVFVRLGLKRGERCVYFLPPDHVERMRAAMAAQGIDVQAEIARTALVLISQHDYLVGGRFDPETMIAGLRDALETALADGFTGLRATGDVAWELGPNPDFSVLPDYEARLDEALDALKLVGLCQYRRADYPPDILAAVMRNHQSVCLDGDVILANPYHHGPCPSSGLGSEMDRIEGRFRDLAERARRHDDALRSEVSRDIRDRLARVLERMSDAFIALDPEWRITYANAEGMAVLGVTPDNFIGRPLWDFCSDPERSHAAVEFRRAMAEQVAVHFQYKAAIADGEKWLDISAYPSPEGLSIFYRDITDRKRAEERQALLMREVDHRAKNALAMAQSVVMLTHAETMPDFIAAVEGRIAALARVHTLLADGKWSGADLRGLAEAELAPFAQTGPDRVRLRGPAVVTQPDAAQPVAMVLHELATNAAKYGALSVPSGRVEVCWTRLPDGRLRLDWRESGGPAVSTPSRRGFGSQMIALAVTGQLDGEADFDWRPDGLHCSITIAGARLVNGSAPSGRSFDDRPGPETISLVGRRILLVEDDALLAMGMQLGLESLGCQVVGPAGTVDAALRLAATETVDGAVLDVNLRGRESWTVADILVERGIPHLFTTGYGDVAPKVKQRGAAMLSKPFSPDRLAPALRQVIARN